jgi:hypothetical protein
MPIHEVFYCLNHSLFQINSNIINNGDKDNPDSLLAKVNRVWINNEIIKKSLF